MILSLAENSKMKLSVEILPLCGSILQAWTCQILSLAENQRWSQVWQLPHGGMAERNLATSSKANSDGQTDRQTNRKIDGKTKEKKKKSLIWVELPLCLKKYRMFLMYVLVMKPVISVHHLKHMFFFYLALPIPFFCCIYEPSWPFPLQGQEGMTFPPFSLL